MTSHRPCERLRLLDLCCGAGGAAAGYVEAGFEVVGVDINPQPHYPFTFHQGDAIEFVKEHGHNFDAIHASWPCQAYSKGAGQRGTRDKHPDLIAAGREAMVAAGKPYVIENIEQARPHMLDPVILCGQMFGLGVFRHRCFEMPWYAGSRPAHSRHDGRVGDGRYVTVAGKPGGRSSRDGICHGSTAQWKSAMGIDWMPSRALAQAIPPAYSHWVGQRLISFVHSQ